MNLIHLIYMRDLWDRIIDLLDNLIGPKPVPVPIPVDKDKK